MKIRALSPFGEEITLQAPCDYFKHERLVYWIDTEVYQPTFLTTSLSNGWLTLSMVFDSSPTPPTSIHLRLLDGSLLANGILVEYYSNDNLLETAFTRRIVAQTEDYYTPSEYDRYSFRASCYIKAPYSETYFFTGRSGTRVIVNSKVVVLNGESSGSVFLSREVWTLLEV